MTTEVDYTRDVCAKCGITLVMPETGEPSTHECPETVKVFTSMIGVTMASVTATEDMVFQSEDGRKWRFYHAQDCCENVSIEDIIGDLGDLVGSPILQAEEVSSDDGAKDPESAESFTWTFYKFATIKGSVTVRWLGESNGYYSESVDFAEPDPCTTRAEGK